MAKSSRSLPRLIGVIHLPPLVGAPAVAGLEPEAVLAYAGRLAVDEAAQLARAGFEAVILENFGDAPFFKDRVPPETVACLSVIAAGVREAAKIPIGINVLRNDASAALAIAAVTGCALIRVNVLTGIAATDQGMIEGVAAQLLRERARLGARALILADVHVKHAQALHSRDIALAVEEAAGRGLADAVIITGSTTGRAVDPEILESAGAAASEAGVPLYIGSGARPEALEELYRHAHGVIVGSAIRQGGRAGQPLDSRRVAQFVTAYRSSAARRASRGRKKASAAFKKRRKSR